MAEQVALVALPVQRGGVPAQMAELDQEQPPTEAQAVLEAFPAQMGGVPEHVPEPVL
jgi:hypothetical protein